MKLINAWKDVLVTRPDQTKSSETVAVTQEDINRDFKELRARHKKAFKEVPLWNAFGGVITIGNCRYQVCQ